MFHAVDLGLRLAAAALPSEAGYAATLRVTPRLGGERRRWIAEVVRREVLAFVADPELAAEAGRRFVGEIACDDLDAVTASAWSTRARLEATTLEGAERLPTEGPLVVTSFHFSGGFRIFDVLRARGLRPTFLHAPPRREPRTYDATIQALRVRHLKRVADPPFVEPGPGARERLDRHLGGGGAVVALLDVAPATLDLRDHVECTLLGRPLRLPVGLLRLAIKHGAPVVPYEGRIEDGRRVLAFHPTATGDDPEVLLREVLRTFEGVLRSRPWTWQGWLEMDSLFGSV